MNTVIKLAVVTASTAALLACEPVEQVADPVPSLGDVVLDADEVGLVDRQAALAGASEPGLADEGLAIDLQEAGDGFLFAFSGQGMVDAPNDTARDADPTYQNVWAGVAAVAFAETIRIGVTAPPRVAMAVAVQGTVEQVEFNVWRAENTIELPAGDLTTHFTVAWVGVGWLAEMRVTDADRDHALWFTGFVSNDLTVGWWDIYDNGVVAGVVEWDIVGPEQTRFDIAATAGPHAGAWLSYQFLGDHARIDAFDAATQEDAWVMVRDDESGEVRLPDFKQGEVSCWDAGHADAICE